MNSCKLANFERQTQLGVDLQLIRNEPETIQINWKSLLDYSQSKTKI